MTDSYVTNPNISNNIMIPNHNHSLKERKLTNNQNKLIVYSFSHKQKPESIDHKINVPLTSFPLKEETTTAEEDIDYLKLFSQKNKNSYDNQNNRVRKSKFFYSNRINKTLTQNPIQTTKQIQRAVSSNLNQIPQKNYNNYSYNKNLYLSGRNSNKENNHSQQSRYNSTTAKGLGNEKKINNIIIKNIDNKEQRTS